MPVAELNLAVNISVGDGYLQDKGQKQLMFIFWGIIMPIIGVIGFIGNILNIIVLFRMEMKSTTIYFLRTLVVTDTGIIIGCIMGLSSVSITQLYPENPGMVHFTDVIYPHIYTPVNYIVMTLQFINVWVTVAVAIERYISICHPFTTVHICNKRNAFILIGSIIFIAVGYNIPRWFAITVTACDNKTNCFSIVSTDLGKTEGYEQYYAVYAYMVIIYIIPLVLLGILNTLLIKELMRMRRRRSVPTPNENSETNMSIVLVLIVVVFILCQTPGLVAQFWFLGEDVLTKWLCVSNTLFALNASVNFLIYTAVGRKFRHVLFKTFKHVCSQRRSLNQNGSYSHNGGTEMTKLTNMQVYDSEDMTDETCTLKCKR
ncbi:FMRFamide receptor-like [Dreissena polymorpha]|uniref:G-protein coupled receptors family 1 profile domain-containing protein n=1 Tax=Dreissena polymorpha TaxID=45954 RepID=A0A9D4RCW0_DREPO|nr:FMRFamide receptor-like [Dreissena polymorpha]XP_052263191.1 FMRFamide receptor-like [Dreissena polymorpha]XP_052263192.1 FMRFamide receptor-like [Dreissena polymorpha]XP_052263193.1 FMRFamide receptor-like [Dreissena polymorpha]XP_052263194.1 FMRFamide receptor-like [Dreissena polymorpha]XP_052263195.1 FMRFamide receptor-like [Dreissena polymorpha]XP_052263196.1 FMRFamide receptor-like [Dreissena polymorpha]XP_052263197.1 FMRFamide receptor-like [Dreissena polymorpha]XP_052263199.1 FMRF